MKSSSGIEGVLESDLDENYLFDLQAEFTCDSRAISALVSLKSRVRNGRRFGTFVYDALDTIAAFVRTDPEVARELLMDLADFTRYSFRNAGEFTTLAEELRNVDRYLTLERARFGDRLEVRLQIAPQVLPVVLPFLALQPLVENAVRHGLGGKSDGGTITVIAEDTGTECVISVEDDGVGMDPAKLRDEIATPARFDRALADVHEALRSAFGDDYGLVVETERGAGMKVSLRVPKFRIGVRAANPLDSEDD